MNLVETLISRVNKKPPTILVIGDVMVDHWLHVRSQECQDGCQKLVRRHHVKVPGGAGNARKCLTKWDNVDARLCGQYGDDRPHKWRFIDENGRILFRYDDEHQSTTHQTISPRMISRSSAVLISDYDKGFLNKDRIKEIIDLCAELCIPCVADVKREPAIYRGAILKCNEDYAHRFSQSLIDHPEVVVTRGNGPPLMYYGTMSEWHDYNLAPVECVNHVGAGDCFAAHMTLALACNFSLEDAARIAHSAGRVYVQHRHNRPPRPHEIAHDISSAR